MKQVPQLIILLFLVLIFSPSFAQDESLTITTYYPSPNGSYHELHSDQMTIGSSYRSGVTPPTDGLVVQGNVGIGTKDSPSDVELYVKSNIGNADIGVESNEGHQWTMSSDSIGNWILNRDIPGTLPTIVANQSGNVGIGTMNPLSTATPVPNGVNTVNLDANDVWLRGAGRWASQEVLSNVIRIVNTNSIIVGRSGGGDTGWVTLGTFTFTVPSGTTLFVNFTASLYRGNTVQWNMFRFLLDGVDLPGETGNWGGSGAGTTKDTICISRIIVIPNTGSSHTISIQLRTIPDWSEIQPNNGILNVLVFQRNSWPSGLIN